MHIVDQHGSWHLEFDPARNCRHRGESLERSWPHERHIGRHSGHPGYLGSGRMGLTFSSIARVKKSDSWGETLIFLDVAGYFGGCSISETAGILMSIYLLRNFWDDSGTCWCRQTLLDFPKHPSNSWRFFRFPSVHQLVHLAGSPHRPPSGPWPSCRWENRYPTRLRRTARSDHRLPKAAMGGGFQVVMEVPGSRHK